MNSDAKVLLLYVQGLPESSTDRSLGELARKLDMKGRAYQQAKRQLTENGYLHEWRSQGDGGRWATEQLLTSTPLTRDEAKAVRAKLSSSTGQLAQPEGACSPPPGERFPTVGEPTSRPVGGYEPRGEHYEETTSHPPSEEQAKAQTEPHQDPNPEASGSSTPVQQEQKEPPQAHESRQLTRAEKVLLSLRHSRRELFLGVGEARVLAVEAAKWLERGVSEPELRHALLGERPAEGVRSAFGFLRHRLTTKCPVPPAPVAPPEPPPPPVRALIACAAESVEEHMFRPLGDETECPECRRATAYASWMADTDTYDFPPDMTWRQRIVAVAKADALRGRTT
ncbi:MULTISPECIES: hypothetical protein [unclassified Streptomyces]|uniref:hypothetical protein n=1 Tax=unclassified Streptomyces TaxID=2593676 RepID=UPI0033A89710